MPIQQLKGKIMINLIQQLRMEAAPNKKDTVINSGDILAITTTQYKNRKRKQIIRGVCIGIKKRVGYTTVKLRNIIAGEAVEQTFLTESPIINHIEKLGSIKHNRSAKKNFLRLRPPSETKV